MSVRQQHETELESLLGLIEVEDGSARRKIEDYEEARRLRREIVWFNEEDLDRELLRDER
jgi:hypothetical protein